MAKASVHEMVENLQEEFKTFRKEMVEVKSALLSIESTLKFYGDMYQLNKENIDKLDTRVTTLETKCYS